MGKYWKIRRGLYGYITDTGRRGIAKSKSEAQRLAGKKRRFFRRRSKSTKKSVRRNVRMPRRRKTRRSGFGLRSIFKLIRYGALVAPGAEIAFRKDLPLEDKPAWILARYTGYDYRTGKFSTEDLKKGWLPFVLVSLITTGIQKINGIIRRL